MVLASPTPDKKIHHEIMIDILTLSITKSGVTTIAGDGGVYTDLIDGNWLDLTNVLLNNNKL